MVPGRTLNNERSHEVWAELIPAPTRCSCRRQQRHPADPDRENALSRSSMRSWGGRPPKGAGVVDPWMDDAGPGYP